MKFWANKKILVTGGDGFFGKAIVKELLQKSAEEDNIIIPKYPEDNLLEFEQCLSFTKGIDIVIHLAAKVGGILFNQKYPASIIQENLQMGLNIMEASKINNVSKIINIGTTCGYPKDAPVPFKESDLWNGYPAEVTAPYGLAKKMLHELGKAYYTEYKFLSNFILPVNLYGPEDHFEGENTHVVPALIKKFVDAKKENKSEVIVWGTGKATREFIYIEDAAKAVLLVAEKYDKTDVLNLGTGIETPIKKLVEIISELVGYRGKIVWDSSKPDGTLRRCLDISKIKDAVGFTPEVNLEQGLKKTIEWYKGTL